ncbi:hypothetical protein D3C78_1651110 [compost metagenome]
MAAPMVPVPKEIDEEEQQHPADPVWLNSENRKMLMQKVINEEKESCSEHTSHPVENTDTQVADRILELINIHLFSSGNIILDANC